MRKRAEPGPSPDENRHLRGRLLELEETLRAIRSGEVDALVVETAGEDQVFTLHGADQIIALPTLIRKFPPPMKRILGDLSNRERTLIGMELSPGVTR